MPGNDQRDGHPAADNGPKNVRTGDRGNQDTGEGTTLKRQKTTNEQSAPDTASMASQKTFSLMSNNPQVQMQEAGRGGTAVVVSTPNEPQSASDSSSSQTAVRDAHAAWYRKYGAFPISGVPSDPSRGIDSRLAILKSAIDKALDVAGCTDKRIIDLLGMDPNGEVFMFDRRPVPKGPIDYDAMPKPGLTGIVANPPETPAEPQRPTAPDGHPAMTMEELKKVLVATQARPKQWHYCWTRLARALSNAIIFRQLMSFEQLNALIAECGTEHLRDLAAFIGLVDRDISLGTCIRRLGGSHLEGLRRIRPWIFRLVRIPDVKDRFCVTWDPTWGEGLTGDRRMHNLLQVMPGGVRVITALECLEKNQGGARLTQMIMELLEALCVTMVTPGGLESSPRDWAHHFLKGCGLRISNAYSEEYCEVVAKLQAMQSWIN